jgi:hypothetical protein
MNKAVLLCAIIGWQSRYDENCRPIDRYLAVSMRWMPSAISRKNCVYNYRVSEQFVDYMRRHPKQIDILTGGVVSDFAIAAMKLMTSEMMPPYDVCEACEELKRKLPEGLRSFLADDKIWIHHFNEVFHVSKGCRYRGDDGCWHEAEDDMAIVLCGFLDNQMMSQAEFEAKQRMEL